MTQPSHINARTSTLSSTVDVFVAFVRHLEANNHSYCVLGNMTQSPLSITGDVDITVSAETLKILIPLVKDFCQQHGLKLVQIMQHEVTAYGFFLVWQDNDKNIQHLILDICSDYYRDGEQLLSAFVLLNDSRAMETACGLVFYVPTPSASFIYYLLKKIGKNNLSESSGAFLNALYTQEPDVCAYWIQQFWGDEDAACLTNAAENNQWSSITTKLKHYAVSRTRKTHPNQISNLWRKTQRVLKPTGLWLVVTSEDESLLSTFTEQLLTDLGPAFRQQQLITQLDDGDSFIRYYTNIHPKLVRSTLLLQTSPVNRVSSRTDMTITVSTTSNGFSACLETITDTIDAQTLVELSQKVTLRVAQQMEERVHHHW